MANSVRGPGTLRIATLNICGLNDIKKRQRFSQGLRLLQADIGLQETHIEESRSGLLKNLGFRFIAGTTQGTLTRGVAILAQNNKSPNLTLPRWGGG